MPLPYPFFSYNCCFCVNSSAIVLTILVCVIMICVCVCVCVWVWIRWWLRQQSQFTWLPSWLLKWCQAKNLAQRGQTEMVVPSGKAKELDSKKRGRISSHLCYPSYIHINCQWMVKNLKANEICERWLKSWVILSTDD